MVHPVLGSTTYVRGPPEQQDTTSAQADLAETDEDSALVQVDIRNSAAACLGGGVVMSGGSSTLPRPGRHTVIAGVNADDLVGTRLAAVPVIAYGCAGSETPGPAPAIGYEIEGALA